MTLDNNITAMIGKYLRIIEDNKTSIKNLQKSIDEAVTRGDKDQVTSFKVTYYAKTCSLIHNRAFVRELDAAMEGVTVEKQEVFMVIDDYTPDAGSTIYGIFSTKELAEDYVDTGIIEDYGDGMDTSNIDIRSETVLTK